MRLIDADALLEAAKADSEREIVQYDNHIAKLGRILTDTANALKGEPAELTSHSWHDLANKANELKVEITELKAQVQVDAMDIGGLMSMVDSREHTIKELTAHINVLREALEIARDYQFDAVNQFHNDFAGYKDEKHEQYDYDLKLVENALASTPAQSLQAHDDEVIVRCVKHMLKLSVH